MTVPAIILLAPHSNLGFPLYMAYNIHNFESRFYISRSSAFEPWDMVLTDNIFSGTTFDPFRCSRDLSDIFYPKSAFDMSRLKKTESVPINLTLC